MTTEILKTNTINNYDATPVVVPTAGEGSSGAMKVQTDELTTTTAGGQWSQYRLCRFPTTAKIKHVWAYVGAVDSSSGAAWVGDFNVAFSDSTVDGTPALYQGTIPSSKLDGTSLAFVAATGYSGSYANSGTGNKMFGQITAANSSAVTYKEITFNGTVGSGGFVPANREDDLWDVFGFTNNAGAAQDPGGYFDILVVVSTAAATAHAGILGVEVDYVS